MEYPQTKIRIMVKVGINLGDYNRLDVEAEIEDWRRKDETTSEAWDRIYDLLDRKLEEKVIEKTKSNDSQ